MVDGWVGCLWVSEWVGRRMGWWMGDICLGRRVGGHMVLKVLTDGLVHR